MLHIQKHTYAHIQPHIHIQHIEHIQPAGLVMVSGGPFCLAAQNNFRHAGERVARRNRSRRGFEERTMFQGVLLASMQTRK